MKNIIKKVLNKIVDYITYFLAYIFNILPHPKDYLVFESNSDLQDNTKALFDFMLDNNLDKKYNLIWVIRDFKKIEKYTKKYKTVKFIKFYTRRHIMGYFKMLYYTSIAKYTFYSHAFIGVPTNKKQIRFFLTHAAVPIKNSKNMFWNYKNNTYILSTSEFAAFYRCLTFNGGIEKVQMLGFPRNDYFFKNNKQIKKVLNIESFKKIIIWMPTFKHHISGDRNDFMSSKENDITILSPKNMKKINESLSQNNNLLIIKFHPAQDKKFVSTINDSNILTISNEELAEKNVELYSLLGICDALITDFSSVYFDYLLTNRMIGFDLCDAKDYKNGVGFLMKNPTCYMPGDKIYCIKDFIDFLDNVNNNIDNFKSERELLRSKVHNYLDGNSSKRIIEFLKLGGDK